MSEHLVCAVMAGGSGTRFWPMSRRARPKQLLALLEPQTLLRATLARVAPLCPSQRQIVVTAAHLVDAVKAELPELPPGHVVGEPTPRNTAPCMALAAIMAQQLDPQAVLALLPADHHIAQPARFLEALGLAVAQAEQGHIVTLGVAPTHPETGFGYIELADRNGDQGVFDVVRFVEKPDRETAARYLLGGRHLWNGGVFVLRADVALEAIAAHLPGVAGPLAPLAEGLAGRFDSASFAAALEERFGQCTSVSIDYGVMEHRSDLRAVRLDAGWSDVGSWGSLIDHREAGEDNFTRGQVVAIDCRGSVLVAEPGMTLTAVGLHEVALVATADAVLALPLQRSQDVREAVAAWKDAGRGDLL